MPCVKLPAFCPSCQGEKLIVVKILSVLTLCVRPKEVQKSMAAGDLKIGG